MKRLNYNTQVLMSLKSGISFCIIASSLLIGCADFHQANLAYQQEDYQLAQKHWQELADLGFPEALIELGKLVELSPDQPQEAALKYYQQAYDLGYDPAAYRIGKYYYKHSKNDQDIALAEEWAIKAAKYGNTGAYLLYANILLSGQSGDEDKELTSALSIVNNLSDNGYAPASRKLASLYEKGIYVEQDKKTALFYYDRAFSQGSLESELDIGRFYAHGYVVETDFNKAQSIFERFVEAGNAQAAFLLGELFQRRFVIEKKPFLEQSIQWFERSADMGYVPAKLKLIDLKLQGKADAAELETAVIQLQELSRLGVGQASYRLGRLMGKGKVTGNKPEELKYYQLAYEQGYEIAAFRIAEYYYKNQQNEDDTQNYQQWLAIALQQQSNNAQLRMAEWILQGQGVEQNTTKAIAIYQSLSAKGMSSASRNLGKIYEQGSYVDQDFQQSLFYFKRAVDQGDRYAELDIARFYAHGLGVESDWPLANSIFLRYADAGSSKAAYLLAKNLEQQALTINEGIPEQSVYWYKMSAEQDYLPAQLKVITMMLEGQGMAQNITQAKSDLQALSNQGVAVSSYSLAEIAAKEDEKNVNQAIHFYQLAFLQGSDKPVLKLVSFYQQGYGLDDNKIMSQYRASAETGRVSSAYLLAVMYDSLNEYDQATQWYQKAAKENHVKAQMALVSIYEKAGKHSMAMQWLKKAVEARNGRAMLKYGEALFFGRHIKTNRVEGLAYVLAAARLHTWNATRISLDLMSRLNNADKIKQANKRSKNLMQAK